MRGMRFLTAIGNVFLVMLAGLGGVPSLAVGGDPAIEPFTEMELIDERIDLNAQRSLLRISKTNRVVEAKLMFKAVKSGVLGGIYKADTQIPALRAVRMGTLWFNLIEKGRDSRCLKVPQGEKPIIVFRKSLVEPQTKAIAMDAALLSGFSACGFKATVPPQPGNQQGGFLVTVFGQGKQLTGAEIRIMGTIQQPVFFGVTGLGGTASFNPPVGEYTVFVTKKGFEFAFRKVQILGGVSIPLVVGLTELGQKN